MDALLTPALAQKNPNAYRARFKRLSRPEQAALVARLSPSDFVVHAAALGEVPTVEVGLSTDGDALSFFRVELGGLRVNEQALDWGRAAACLRVVLEGLPDAVRVTGFVSLPLEVSAAARALAGLEALGWRPGEAFFSRDATDGGRIRYAFAEAVVVVAGSTGRGDFRAHAAVPGGASAAAQPAWAALCAARGLGWRVA
ncbi:MAG: hypothetical protein ACOZQL_07095 [Myxococcota bacterium]